MIVKSSMLRKGKILIACYIVAFVVYSVVAIGVWNNSPYLVYLTVYGITGFILAIAGMKTVSEYRNLVRSKQFFESSELECVTLKYAPIGAMVSAVFAGKTYLLRGIVKCYNKPIERAVADFDEHVLYIPYSCEIYYESEG